METFSRNDLDALISPSVGPCVSIYIPTHRAGVVTLQDPVRLRNRLREAQHRLRRRGVRSVEIGHLLKPLTALASDYNFWQHQRDGLVLFRSADVFRFFRLPVVFEDLLVIADRFHIRPLLPLLSEGDHFFVLAISQNALRLLDCRRDRADDLKVPPGIPKSIAEFLQYAGKKELQLHSVGPRGKTRGFAVFHGQDDNGGEGRDRLLRYFREIDRGICSILRNDCSPLVVAAVEHCCSLYRAVSCYNNLVPEGICGNPETLQSEVLRKRAWEIVRRWMRGHREDIVAMYGEALSRRRTLSDVKEIVRAARDGRVAQLLVAMGSRTRRDRIVPGVGDDSPDRSPGDLIDLAAIYTLIRGGSVSTLEPSMIPGEVVMAAVLRY